MKILILGAAATGILAGTADANACGGCFAPPPIGTTVPPVVTSHRMALSISTDQTVLWDQIRYSGEPSEFAWVLPVKAGARLEIASDAWFDVLDAATSPFVIPPTLDCGGGCGVTAGAAMGCGDSGESSGGDPADADNVNVLSHASVGPYETVTLHAEDPNALADWLDSHDYAIPDDILPVVDDYIDEGFDFIALRLLPGAGVQQMRPVRVVQSGASPTLPLRMVAAGSGARTAITLFVIGEGRYTTSNFAEGTIDTTQLTYDFNTGLTNYTTLRDSIFEQNAQQTFLTEFAMKGALYRHIPNPSTGVPVVFRVSGAQTNPYATTSPGYTTVADAYVQQGFINGEASSTACADQLASIALDTRRVVDLCDDSGECRDVHPGTEIDRRTLACDAPIGSDIVFDDAAVALTGLHPADVWVTRLEANLGRSAFGRDLEVTPAGSQGEISPFVTAGSPTNAPCDVAASIAKSDGRVRTPRERARLGVAMSVLVVAGAVLARRARRKKTESAPRRDEVGQ